MTYALYALLLSSQVAAPVNTVLPVISGTAQVGLTLSVSNGTWTNNPTFTYQWTLSGSNILGATTNTYAPQGSDVGSVVTCVVTGTNTGGSNTATAVGSTVVAAVFSLVGTAGSATVGSLGAAVTASYGAGETRAANNLLVCWVDGFNHSNLPTTPSGWSIAEQDGVGSPIFGSSTIFYKIATGGDAAPTIALVSGEVWIVRLAEFQGNAHTTPLDQIGLASGSSPRTATLASTDAAAKELVVSAAAIIPTTSTTVTSSTAMNNGATATTISNDGSSTGTHYSFSYGITTGNAGADTSTVTSTGTLSGIVVVAASFKLAT